MSGRWHAYCCSRIIESGGSWGSGNRGTAAQTKLLFFPCSEPETRRSEGVNSGGNGGSRLI